MKNLTLMLILFFLISQIHISGAANEAVKVNLGFERSIVKEGDGVMVTLSAINPETNPHLNIQLILTVPDEMSITSTEFIKSGGRQYTTTYLIKPGDERHINIHLKTHKPGVYYIKGDYYYYFDGADSTKKHGNESKNINVMPSIPTPSPTSVPSPTPTPGPQSPISPWIFIFFFEFAILGVLYTVFNLHDRLFFEMIVGIVYAFIIGPIINFSIVGMGIWSSIHFIIGLLIIHQALKSSKSL